MEKDLRLSEKPQKFSSADIFPYTVADFHQFLMIFYGIH